MGISLNNHHGARGLKQKKCRHHRSNQDSRQIVHQLNIEDFISQFTNSMNSQVTLAATASDNEEPKLYLRSRKSDKNNRSKTGRKKQNGRRIRKSKSKRHLSLHVPLCQPEKSFTDLGAGHYPRLVQTASCGVNSCGDNLSLRCQETAAYSVSVLMSNHSQQCGDERLPFELREDWTIRDVPVITGCSCITWDVQSFKLFINLLSYDIPNLT